MALKKHREDLPPPTRHITFLFCVPPRVTVTSRQVMTFRPSMLEIAYWALISSPDFAGPLRGGSTRSNLFA